MHGWCDIITTIYKDDYVMIKKESDGTYFAHVKVKSKGVDKNEEPKDIKILEENEIRF